MGSASPEVIGRYTIYGKIASGGMASVHFGRLQGGAGFSRTVAIKRLHPHLAEDPEFMATMIDEARLAARIHHPNVVPTLDVVSTEGELLVVMEYVRGESLARLAKVQLERGGRVPLAIASAVAIGALHGLHAAHEATNDRGTPLGIVHRDVSPQNILVGIDGLPRVIDFGVAKAAGRLQTTQDGTIKGKIAYMAPEQLAGLEVTRRADVYAMGVVLWELLTGQRLFRAEADAALVAKVLAGASTPPSSVAPELPAELDAVVMAALALDPSSRFSTALDMAQALMGIVPPAFPTHVGAWCEVAARESIAKRGAVLAEIESHSGIVPAAVSSAPDVGSGARARVSQSAPLPGPVPPIEDEATIANDPDDPRHGAPQHAAPPRTPLTGANAEAVAPGMDPRRAALVGIGGAAVLVVVALAVWSSRSDSAVDRPQSSDRAPVAHQPSAEPPREAPEPPPPPAASPASATVEPLPSASSPPPIATSSPRSATPPPSPPRVAAPRSSAARPPAAVNCSPPFTLDALGHRQYKPECL